MHVTVLEPSGNVEGDDGEHAIPTARLDSSVAVAVYVATADGELPVVLYT